MTVPSLPGIALPKGGGAIRGIGETFAANPVTGTGTMTVPIATSPGRGGFGPQLALSYDSGAANGPFGFGWSLSLPSITRKTEKGLPRYDDVRESDVFLIFGAEDLVPELKKDAAGQWLILEEPRVVDGVTYLVRRYRPRIEGLFARIERWARQTDGDVHWRSISRENLLTVYGSDAASRIADPDDARRVFTWLIRETRDDRGNAVVYDYKTEDGTGMDVGRANERNRGNPTDPRRMANRYLKRIRYGNRVPLLDATGSRPRLLTSAQVLGTDWAFELVLDYGEHHPNAPKPADAGSWSYRDDPFSSYRAGFEVRTTRLCQRVLMFHHFPAEAGVGSDCLVRSTDFTYSHEVDPANARNPVYTFLLAVTQYGYRRQDGGYVKRGLPPLELEYSLPTVRDEVREVDGASLENLPVGADGSAYRWTDLHGEGLPGLLTEQAGAWFYKRNLSALAPPRVSFSPLEVVAARPNLSTAGERGARFMDLAGDGQPDLVLLDGPVAGLSEHDDQEGWKPFRPFGSRLDRDTRDPNLRLVDLDGDGHADVLITEQDALVWHTSLAEDGFGPAQRVAQAADEETGPRLVFADGTQSVHLADLSGDGLSDLVRIRSGEVCYWPNLGYGRFGAKVTMDRAPDFDTPEHFDPRRLRLADLDGTGTTDIVYLHRDGVRLYFNQSGNGWSAPQPVRVFPQVDALADVDAVDLLGNGTACLVWSSPLPGAAGRQMRYVDLMGGRKPHLLTRVTNNLGAESRVEYAPSTRFYLQDRREGRPWISRLPFPVQVVERVETYDHVGRNRFVTRYAYHHGYFDGDEREFRGFGMVEQWDTESFAALTQPGAYPIGENVAAASHVPPAYTKTWSHTGVYLRGERVSDYFAGLLDANDRGEYFREPGLTDAQARALLLPDTLLPPGLTAEEEREACRALKGSLLRREVYALDGTAKEAIPYAVTEQNFTIRSLQPRGINRNGVFFTHLRESISYHYERDPADPRVQHALTLEVDGFGDVLKEAAIGYGRRQPDLSLPLPTDRDQQLRRLVTYTEHRFTNAVDEVAGPSGSYRAPVPCETRTFELTGYAPTGAGGRFQPSDLVQPDPADPARLVHIRDGEVGYEITPGGGRQRRSIEQVRTLYRPDDLGAGVGGPLALLPLGTVQPLALAGESYRLAFTPGLLVQVYRRDGVALLPAPANVLGGAGPDRGGYLASQALKADGRFPGTDADDHWWIPSGRVFFSPNGNDTAAQELAYARQHFFLPLRSRDPFHTAGASTESFVRYDAYDLLLLETRDALGNRVTAGRRGPTGEIDPLEPGNEYRVLQPRLLTDANRNRTEATFDTLGFVVATALKGKDDSVGDTLAGFALDLTQTQLDAFYDVEDPHAAASGLLAGASTRFVYDLDRFRRTRQLNPLDPARWLPVYAASLARETHVSDPLPPQGLRIRIGFSYSDGFGREIQRKAKAEPGPLLEGGPVVPRRWVGSGWTIFDNKGLPVRKYESFFSQLPEKRHRFEYGAQVGVSAVVFYDPLGRAVATLHPDHSYEKAVFGPWRHVIHDVNDTCAASGAETGDPRTDPDVGRFVAEYFKGQPAGWQTWYQERIAGANGAQEKSAAEKAALHAGTPATTHLDTLGRPFLRVTDNGPDPALPGPPRLHAARVELDIEGNPRAVRDAIVQAGDPRGRLVARWDYDLLGRRIHQSSLDAGDRWTLADAVGKTIRAWTARGHTFRSQYDRLRRPLRSHVTGADPANPAQELLVERLVYGEQHPDDDARNLRGRLYLHLDQAGAAGKEAFDFKGNLLRATRRIAREYRQAIDWSVVDAALPADPTVKLVLTTLEGAVAPLVEAATFTSRATFDALDRPLALTMPSTPAMQPNVVRLAYNDANLLERLDVQLNGATAGGAPVWTPFLAGVDYDAGGRRTLVAHGNGAVTTSTFDPRTFRLTRLLTRRPAPAFSEDCPAAPTPGWPGCHVQDLRYTYDPAGNPVHLRDEAQQSLYFRQKRVEPSAEYTYDPLYRLVAASGREHLGQIGGTPIPHSYDDAPRVRRPWSANDGTAMGRYVESYTYDEAGNLREVVHRGSDPIHAGWSRTYTYDEGSALEPGKRSNRLTRTTIGPASLPDVYSTGGDGYDAHGNLLRMPQLQQVQWNYKDQLSMSRRQAVNATDLAGIQGQGERTWYVYDAAGERVRKVTELASGQVKDERLYLGGLELYRRAGASPLVRETLHVTDDTKRIAIVETRTQGSEPGVPARLVRYQFGNHLGSATLELDHQAQIVSYEEYSPYGSTSYQAVRSQTETPKRYRHAGKERDDESGLYYHGARYYAAWLGRWVSCDPAPQSGATTLYAYAANNPVLLSDADGRWPKLPTLAEVKSRADQTLNSAGEFLVKATTTMAMPANSPEGKEVAKGTLLGLAELGKREVVNAVKTLPGVSQAVQAKSIADVAPKMATPQGRKELAGQAAKMLESGTISAVRATHKSMKEGNTLDVALAEGFVAYTEKAPFVAGVADTMRKAEQALKANDTKEGAKQLVVAGGEFSKGVAETTMMFEGVTSGGGGAGAAAPEGSASSWRNDPLWIKGQTTRPATPAETARFEFGLRRGNVEVSFTQFDNRDPASRLGDTSSVPIPGGPNVTSTSHTHPPESPAIYSAGDYRAYTTGGYGPNTTHAVTARKWPLTNQFLQTLGLSVETELVTTEITQAQVEVNAAARPHSFWDWLQRNPF